MYEDDEEMEFSILGLSVFGDIMLVLFVGLLVTTTVAANRQFIENSPMGGAKGEESPSIGVEVVVGPGKTININGEPVAIETLLELAGKVPAKKRVRVRMDLDGDPLFYWKVRFELRKSGCGFIEAPPQEKGTQKGRGR